MSAHGHLLEEAACVIEGLLANEGKWAPAHRENARDLYQRLFAEARAAVRSANADDKEAHVERLEQALRVYIDKHQGALVRAESAEEALAAERQRWAKRARELAAERLSICHGDRDADERNGAAEALEALAAEVEKP